MWSRALAPGYLDHPPMVALWIRAGTALAGDGALGVRLLAPFAAALGTRAAGAGRRRPAAGDRRAGLRAAVLLNATLLFGVGAVTMTPDTPLLFFWTATLWALARLLATGRRGLVARGGRRGGARARQQVYRPAAAPASLAWLLAAPGLRLGCAGCNPGRGRRWRWRLFAPVLSRGTPRMAGRGSCARAAASGDWQPVRALQFVGELLAGQIGLATPLLAVLFAAGRRSGRAPRLAARCGRTLLACLTAAAGRGLPAARPRRPGAGELAGGALPGRRPRRGPAGATLAAARGCAGRARDRLVLRPGDTGAAAAAGEA